MPTENRSSNTEQMVSVPVSALKKIHRDLDACQKVIWLRGGFDPAYCKDAQDSLKEIDTLLAQPTSDGYSAGDMADQGAKAFAARDGEVEELRVQLAERDALCKVLAYHLSPALEANAQYMSKDCLHEALEALHNWGLIATATNAALSASVEPEVKP